jgi:hypothetical protein
VVAFVPWELQFEHIPRINVRGDLHILKSHVITTHSSEKFLFVGFFTSLFSILPIFELPLVAAAKYCDHSLPLSITESLGAVIDIKRNFSFTYHPFDLNWLRSIS